MDQVGLEKLSHHIGSGGFPRVLHLHVSRVRVNEAPSRLLEPAGERDFVPLVEACAFRIAGGERLKRLNISSLVSLSCCFLDLVDEDLSRSDFLDAVAETQSLEALNLSHNSLSDTFAIALASLLLRLKATHPLCALNLSYNRISDGGCWPIARALGNGAAASLRCLDLRANRISLSAREGSLAPLGVPALSPGWTVRNHRRCEYKVRRRVRSVAIGLARKFPRNAQELVTCVCENFTAHNRVRSLSVVYD
jgi:hypothetical protein